MVGRTAHKLLDILFLTLCAVICGMDDWESIEEWALERLQWLRGHVELKNGIPSHDQPGICRARWQSVSTLLYQVGRHVVSVVIRPDCRVTLCNITVDGRRAAKE
jgi:hypothetical protein